MPYGNVFRNYYHTSTSKYGSKNNLCPPPFVTICVRKIIVLFGKNATWMEGGEGGRDRNLQILYIFLYNFGIIPSRGELH